MSSTTITSGEFNRDVGKAKQAAMQGPVFITDQGHAAHVLLTVEQYRDLTVNDIPELRTDEQPLDTAAKGKNLSDLLYCKEVADIPFELPPNWDSVEMDSELVNFKESVS